jgi:hypothetical protein
MRLFHEGLMIGFLYYLFGYTAIVICVFLLIGVLANSCRITR